MFDFAWIDDFAAARNESLARATGDYALWLDADDVLEPAERNNWSGCSSRLDPHQPTAFVVRCAVRSYARWRRGRDGGGPYSSLPGTRKYPVDVSRPRADPARLAAGQGARAVDRHHRPAHRLQRPGAAGPEARADAKILRSELEVRPDDPFILFNLGSIAVERQEWQQALDFLKHSLARSAPTDSITRKLFAQIARVHQVVGDSTRALQTCEEGLGIDPDDAELWFRKAVVHRIRGESTDAEGCWRRILGLTGPNEFCSIDQGIFGHVTRRNLAALAAERGDHAEADKLVARCARRTPRRP